MATGELIKSKSEKGRVLLVANTASYLVTSVEEFLKAHGLDIIPFNSKEEGLRAINGVVDAILIYADESVMARDDLVIYVRDYAAEHNLKIYLIGVSDELAKLTHIISAELILEKFTRPIDTSAVVKHITDYVTRNSAVNKKNILAVDDSGVYLREINSWFSDKYKVTLVNSGLNAIKYLGTHKPDLILLDYEMPVCNGKQVLQMIRSDTDCGDIPVIFLTSNSDRDTIIEIMPLNVAGYLLKTLPSDEIKKYVDDFFEKQSAK